MVIESSINGDLLDKCPRSSAWCGPHGKLSNRTHIPGRYLKFYKLHIHVKTVLTMAHVPASKCLMFFFFILKVYDGLQWKELYSRYRKGVLMLSL